MTGAAASPSRSSAFREATPHDSAGSRRSREPRITVDLARRIARTTSRIAPARVRRKAATTAQYTGSGSARPRRAPHPGRWGGEHAESGGELARTAGEAAGEERGHGACEAEQPGERGGSDEGAEARLRRRRAPACTGPGTRLRPQGLNGGWGQEAGAAADSGVWSKRVAGLVDALHGGGAGDPAEQQHLPGGFGASPIQACTPPVWSAEACRRITATATSSPAMNPSAVNLTARQWHPLRRTRVGRTGPRCGCRPGCWPMAALAPPPASGTRAWRRARCLRDRVPADRGRGELVAVDRHDQRVRAHRLSSRICGNTAGTTTVRGVSAGVVGWAAYGGDVEGSCHEGATRARPSRLWPLGHFDDEGRFAFGELGDRAGPALPRSTALVAGRARSRSANVTHGYRPRGSARQASDLPRPRGGDALIIRTSRCRCCSVIASRGEEPARVNT